MNFKAPKIITGIKDINEIYKSNDRTYSDYNSFLDQYKLDIFIDTMSIDMIEKYEKMLDMEILSGQSEEIRRKNLKDKLVADVAYTYRVLERKITNLLNTENGEYYTLTVDTEGERVNFRLGLEVKRFSSVVNKLLEDIVPLNMDLEFWWDYNTYGRVKNFNIGDLETGWQIVEEGEIKNVPFTYQQMYDTALHLYITPME